MLERRVEITQRMSSTNNADNIFRHYCSSRAPKIYVYMYICHLSMGFKIYDVYLFVAKYMHFRYLSARLLTQTRSNES